MKAFAVLVFVLVPLAPLLAAPNPRYRTAATEELVRKNIDILRNGTPEERIEAAKALLPLGPNAALAVQALISTFEEYPAPSVGEPIAQTLAAIGPAAKSALPALIEIVRIPTANHSLLQNVAKAIAALGDPGNKVMVRAGLSTDDRDWRMEAELMIDWNNPAYISEVLLVVADCLDDENLEVRRRAGQRTAPG